jgi:hypothetical protein
MKLIKPIVLLIFLMVTMSASAVMADTVSITAGSVVYSRSQPRLFSLSGAGLTASGTTPTLNPSVSLLSNGVISPGGFGLTGGSVDSLDSELLLAVPVTVGGVTYVPGSSILQLGFSSGAFTAPVNLASGFIVIAPFTLTTGLIEGYSGAIGQGNPLFSSDLTGTGTTTLSFLLTPSGQYQLQNQTFTFGQTVSGVTVQSVPEPASVLLLGSALTALGVAGRKRIGYRKAGAKPQAPPSATE